MMHHVSAYSFSGVKITSVRLMRIRFLRPIVIQ